MWMANTRLLTLAAIVLLVVAHLLWTALPQEAGPLAATASVRPAESWDRPTLFELMDPSTGSEAAPVLVAEEQDEDTADGQRPH